MFWYVMEQATAHPMQTVFVVHLCTIYLQWHEYCCTDGIIAVEMYTIMYWLRNPVNIEEALSFSSIWILLFHLQSSMKIVLNNILLIVELQWVFSTSWRVNRLHYPTDDPSLLSLVAGSGCDIE